MFLNNCRHIKADMAQHSQFVIQQNKQAKYYRDTQANLLNDNKEVKRLSNLLIIENTSVSTTKYKHIYGVV